MKRFSKTAALVATAALAAFLALPAGAAGGATVPDQSYRLTAPGTLTIGSQSFPIPVEGTEITGEWDDVTGAFTGTLTIGPQRITGFEGAPGVFVTLDIEMTASGLTATLDPVSGAVDLGASVNVAIQIWLEPVSGPPLASCTISGVALATSSSNAGGAPFDPAALRDTWAFTVTGNGASVPAATCDSGAVTPLINGALGLPTSESSVVLSFVSGQAPPPVPPPPPPPPIVPLPLPVEPPQVGGAQVGAETDTGGGELPRTGTSTPLLAATGIGLLLAGACMVRARASFRRVHDA